jgi:serine/threonine protein kinase
MSSSSDESPEFAGTDRFKLLRQLGEGGMGVVWEALDTDRNQRVALKTLRAFSADALFRFKREFRALQALHHPNLVNLGELIEEGGQWFFTMELVDGVNFVKYVRGEDWHMRASFEGASPPSMTPPSRVPPDFAPTAETDELTMRQLIEHSHKTAYTGEGKLDELKLRVALAQLAEGLGALHRAGKVHRDVKPSNVLVTEEGRVVLLDFGLVAEMEDSHERRVVGTVDYMAPEQALGTAPGPAADWYSVGALVYEAIAGRPPFVGPSMEVLMGKQRFDPLPPSKHDPSVPKYLDDLCLLLLRRDPAQRPGELDILQRIGLGHSPEPISGTISLPDGPSARTPFIGRQAELAELHRAFADSRAGKPVTVVVYGEAGIGRSALVDQFIDELSERAPEAVVLSGRCQERETVPFKAFDGVIDALSRHLLRLPRDQAAALLPENAASMAHLFPVLSRIEAVAALGPAAAALDLPSLRARAFGALRELLCRIGSKRPLVICIDDYQWADADSLTMRREVLRADEPALLFVKTLRPDANHPVANSAEARRITLGRLGDAESRGLVAMLLRNGGITLERRDTEWIDALADEAAGHPLFVDQLVRYALETGERGARAVGLDGAIWSRIRRLDEPLRRIVELLAVAHGPLQQETAAAAAGMEYSEFSRLSAVLRVAHLVRTSGARRGDTIEPYHQQVRQAVLVNLPPEEATRIATFLPAETR